MTVEELTQQHVRAMDLSGQADVLKRNGRADDAKAMLAEAFEIEKAVAMAVERYPSRSILLKSAAVLASECGKFDEAYRLCGLILSEERTPQFVRSEVHLELHSLASSNATGWPCASCAGAGSTPCARRTSG